VAYACVDNAGGSGVDETASTLVASTTVSDEGQRSVASSGTCADNEGNTAQAVSYGPVRVDRTAPAIERSGRTAANASGWNAGDVTVTWSCTDAASGVVDASLSKTVSSDGAEQDIAATCRDRAGNSASASEGHINIDTHKPHIEMAATRADERTYTEGDWTKQDVTVAFACVDNDGGSGVDEDASDLAATRTLSDEGEHRVASAGTCADNAANSAEAASFGAVRIDKTGPLLAFTGERTYSVDEQVEIGCSASDALSGVAIACSGLRAPAHTYAPGTHTITRSATDHAANQTRASATFTVKATPSSLCTLTHQHVRSSARYIALSRVARKVPDALAAAACQPLAAIVAGITPPAQAALVMTYKVTVSVLVSGGWLTSTQASQLKTLAGAL
jgi:hypothetical protein